MSTSMSTGQDSFFFLLVVLLAYSTFVSSSPTPSASTSISLDENHQPHNDEKNNNGLFFQDNDFQRVPSTISTAKWYIQPRARANQFLQSQLNDNDLVLSKWFDKVPFDQEDSDTDDLDDNLSSSHGAFHKRSSLLNQAGFSHLKKRKQLSKPPMEVMNEIVNSIYLKR